MGLGDIYINLEGREAQGIVQPGKEYDALVAEIKARLPEYVDPETGDKPVAYVWTRDEAYGTYDPALIPDMFPSNSYGYRVGWQDALGMIAKSVTEPNLDVWSADHCSVYPPLVDGILFSTRKLSTDPEAVHGGRDADGARALRGSAADQARRTKPAARRRRPLRAARAAG